MDSAHRRPAGPDPSHAAFRAVIAEHGQFLARYVRSLGVLDQDFDDVVQEVLCGIHRSLERFDPACGKMRAWLAAIAFHQVQNHRARMRRRARDELLGGVAEIPDGAPDAEQAAIAGSRRRVLEEILAELPEDRRRVLLARNVLEATIQETAAMCSIPVGTAKTRYRLALRDVREAASGWQARQRKRGLDVLPLILAPLVWSRRAWAAAGRGGLRRGLRVGVAAVLGACILLAPGLVSAPDRIGAHDSAIACAFVPARVEDRRPADAAAAPVATPAPAAPPELAGRPAARSARRGDIDADSVLFQRTQAALLAGDMDADSALFQRAQAALLAANHGEALRLLERHAREFRDSPNAAARAIHLGRLLREGPVSGRKTSRR